MKVVLRADADAHIGYGHLVRTLALGDALRIGAHADCVLVTRSPAGGLSLPLPSTRIELPEGLPPELEGEAIARLLGSVDWVVADLYQATKAHRDALRGKWGLVFVDDDVVADECDLWVCPNLQVDGSFLTQHSNVLSGASYVLLREVFANAPAAVVRDAIERVLVCFGGSDTASLAVQVVSWLADILPKDVQLRVVVPDRWTVPSSMVSGHAIVALSALSAAEMAQEMREADVGVIAAGTLLYEAAALGLPALWVSLNDAQAREADRLALLGAGFHLGRRGELTLQGIAGALRRFDTAGARQLAGRCAQAAIDGRGCVRVAGAITRLHEESPGRPSVQK